MHPYDDDTDYIASQTSPASLGLLFALPLVASGVSLLVGLGVGGLGGYIAAGEPEQAVAVEAIDPNDIRFGEICAPVLEEAQTRIEGLNAQLGVLEDDITVRRAHLVALESELTRRAEGGRRLAAELKQAKEELAVVVQERDMLVVVKTQLVEELTRTTTRLVQTEQALEEQKELTERAVDDSLANNWQRFLYESQIAVCERGNRKKLGACRETVLALIGTPTVQDRFEHCVRSGQATPSVHEIGKGEQLAEFAYWLDQDEKIVSDWYVQLCDPTLPESDGLLAMSR